jgi:hypothetical protein
MLNSTLATKGSFPNMDEVQHPLAKLFNPIPEDELEQLAKGIEKDGLIHEMVLYQQKILDGNTRFEALSRFRRKFLESDFRCLEDILIDPDDKAAERYVISANALRRHLSKTERDILGAKYFLAMPKEKPGPKPEQEEGWVRQVVEPEGDNFTQKLRGIQLVDNSQSLPPTTSERAKVKEPEKRPYDRRLDEAAAMSGGTPGGIRAQVAQITQEKKDPEGAAARAAGKKPPRAPRKPTLFANLTDGLTLAQVFGMMTGKYERLEAAVKDQGRVIFISDADIQPIKEGAVPSREEFLAYAAEEKIDLDCAADQYRIWLKNHWKDLNGTPILNWKVKVLNYATGYFGQFAKSKPRPQQAAQPQRVPARSTIR